MRLFLSALFFLTLALPAKADQTAAVLDDLFAELEAAPTAEAASRVEADIVREWLTPPEEGTAVLVGRILEAIDGGDYENARVLAEFVTRLSPSFAEGFVLKGQSALALDDWASAQTAFEAATALETRHFISFKYLGDIAMMLGNQDGALRNYERALAANPHMDEVRRSVEALRRELEGQEI